MKIELVSFDVTIPNKDGTAILKTIEVRVPCEYDEEIHEWLLTEKAVQTIDYTKATHMIECKSITKKEFDEIIKRLDLTCL